ncbi:hypothetical protein [Burkholderia sp. IMCC1007]|uniref:hypothetical protein n=1 Tax=Burkholderia sp. IMCC1007 TaxID=3004104 RepID=UPI0022B589E3|nr:hypothetical protein [Burkholderia sp. IMCC1007]
MKNEIVTPAGANGEAVRGCQCGALAVLPALALFAALAAVSPVHAAEQVHPERQLHKFIRRFPLMLSCRAAPA